MPTRLPTRIALATVRAYQITLSPWLGRQCRFYPTCSHYAYEAIETHGFARGSWLAVRRLCRCHPLHSGGVDLVPDGPTATERKES
ncbi:MAG: membrane protein insertion efficiency factor YidD [Pseudomonadota bacterium]